jgi:hypothetical protein
LMRPDDDEFLRAHLTSAAFRRVRRSRTLAVQQYLCWIARDCRSLLEAIQTNIPSQEHQIETQVLVRQAIRLRFTSVALWLFLWLQYVVPGLDAMPHGIARRYEVLRDQVASHLGPTRLANALAVR